MENIIKCQEIYKHNIEFLTRISISKVSCSKSSILVSIIFKKGELEINKSFWGDDLDIINNEIKHFINNEIKL